MASLSESCASFTVSDYCEKVTTGDDKHNSEPVVDAQHTQYQVQSVQSLQSSLSEFHLSSTPLPENKEPNSLTQAPKQCSEHREPEQQEITCPKTQDTRTESGLESPTQAADTFSSRFEPVQIRFDFTSLKELLHAKYYQSMQKKIECIDSSAFDRESKDHLDFISGITFLKLRQFKQAKQCLKLVTQRKPSAENTDLFVVYVYLGDVYFEEENFKSAKGIYQKAINLHSSDKPKITSTFSIVSPSLISVHLKLAVTYKNQKKFELALKQYEIALTVAKTDNEKLRVQTLWGNLLRRLGDNHNALTLYLNCIKLSIQLGDSKSLAWSHGNTGLAYLGLQNWPLALEHSETSLPLTLEHEPTPQAISRAYNNLGTVYQASGDFSKAEELYGLALSQAIFGDDKAGQANAYGNIANLAVLQKKYASAILHYRVILSLKPDTSTKMDCMHNLGCALYEYATTELRSHINQDKLPIEVQLNIKIVKVTEHPSFMIQGDPIICGFHSGLGEKAKIKEVKQLLTKSVETLTHLKEHHLATFAHSAERYKSDLWPVFLSNNQRAFHRLVDGLLTLGLPHEALVVTEETRTRCIIEQCTQNDGAEKTNMNSITLPLSYETIWYTLMSCIHATVYLYFTGDRLAIWYFNSEKKLMTSYSFLSDNELNYGAFKTIRDIVQQDGGICRLINRGYSDFDTSTMQQYNLKCEQLNRVLDKLSSFIKQLNETLPTLKQKKTIFWVI
ncbi:tetratricopeptide repeat protein [Parashewanella spongiae]|uniref:Tetratricopeptide repeat protein n=1 Tax=Parashewanella spongiae TaxID=342950 RepID=A0A3A6T7T3_9GAMM|nr:tetratricopeptide repeat protein [Parashewanella spongiae]MCL1079317.1 tetratricopeptide repeat protein [Parashewanella spongiae]RJY10410.1 tetratricopeptide repeat protein [Parashewanella spongiae]